MSKIYIYLAGPVTGEDEMGAIDWRNMLDAHLSDMCPDFVAVSPLRCEPPGDDGMYPTEDDWPTAMAITAKNLLDVRRCDVVFAYLPRLSIGTLQEIGWAVGMGKPVIVLSSLKEVLEHPVLRATVPFLFNINVKGYQHATEPIRGLFEVYT